MRTRRVIGLAASGVATAASLAGPLTASVAADDLPPGGFGGGFVDDAGDPTAVAGTGGGSPGRQAGGGGESPCTWEVLIEDDFRTRVYEVDGTEQHSETGRWLVRRCERTTADGVTSVESVIPEGGRVDPAALALQAMRSVDIPSPVIRTSPPSGRLYVQVPTWLWLDGGWWRPFSATARAGRVTSTVTAQPVSATWSTGDGSSVTCSGPGVPWQPGLPEEATGCSHTYTTASAGAPGGAFELTVTVTLDVAWSSNSGASGVLPTISRTASQAVEVGEIQALETE